MEGIANINKPSGVTSFDVIRVLRRNVKMKRIGHTGTLDPLATGVMVVCFGEATKLASDIEAERKVYVAEMEFGYSTDSYDSEGTIIKTNSDFDYSVIDKKYLNRVFASFLGVQKQIPPMFSALKVNGKRLYELARENIEIEREPREIFIEYIKLVEMKDKKVKFELKVSKGTYIRTVVNDIGEKIGCYATMIALERKSVGEYLIEKSYKLEDIEKMCKNEDFSFIVSVEESFKNYMEYEIIDEKNYKLFKNGNTVVTSDYIDGKYKIYYRGNFEGLGIIVEERLKGYKLF